MLGGGSAGCPKANGGREKQVSFISKKQRHALSDILKGLQYAVNSAQEMLHSQQLQMLSRFWDSGSGEPLSQKVKVGDAELNVPLLTLVPHSHLQMDDVQIKFNAKIGDIDTQEVADKLQRGESLSHADMQMEMEGIKASDNDVMEVTIRFKAKDVPEGVARLTDEYNKLI